MTDTPRGEALRVTDLTKWYASVLALDEASISVDFGETVALVGDNGAGKSSLINIVAGVEEPDGGEIRIAGEPVEIGSAREAAALGICTVHQDFSLADNLSAVDNMFLGREMSIGRGPFKHADFSGMRRRTEEIIGGLGISTIADVGSQVGQLSGGQRQSVAVGRTMLEEFRIVLLDEPTTGLSVSACDRVMATVRQLCERGAAVLIVSQNIDEVFDVADRIVVLHLGRVSATFDKAETTPEEVVGAVMGVEA